MSIRQTSLVTGEYYHLYNRGNSKQDIFHDQYDYRYFINLIAIMNSEKRAKASRQKIPSKIEEKIISIGAFCLMSNHFHILVKQEKENGISRFMQKVSTAYVMYYNKKYKRTGGLFEGKFKSKSAAEDRYLKYLFSYIHLNPLKIVDKNWKTKPITKDKQTFLLKYAYSSLGEYLKGEYIYTDKNSFPDYFPSKYNFTKEIFSWLQGEGSYV